MLMIMDKTSIILDDKKSRKILHTGYVIQDDVIDHLFYQPYASEAENGNIFL